MALKIKKAEVAPVVEETVQEETVQTEVVQTEEQSVLTSEEKEAISKAEEEKERESADTQRLQLATNIVSGKFNLDPSYSVRKFDDRGKVANLTLENKDFILNVTIKDSERHGMHVE